MRCDIIQKSQLPNSNLKIFQKSFQEGVDKKKKMCYNKPIGSTKVAYSKFIKYLGINIKATCKKLVTNSNN